MKFFKNMTFSLLSISLLLFSLDANATNFDYFAQIQYQQQMLMQYQMQMIQYQQMQYMKSFNMFGYGYNMNSYNPYNNMFYNNTYSYNPYNNAFNPYANVTIKRRDYSSNRDYSSSASGRYTSSYTPSYTATSYTAPTTTTTTSSALEDVSVRTTSSTDGMFSASGSCANCLPDYSVKTPGFSALSKFGSALKNLTTKKTTASDGAATLHEIALNVKKETAQEKLTTGLSDLSGLTDINSDAIDRTTTTSSPSAPMTDSARAFLSRLDDDLTPTTTKETKPKPVTDSARAFLSRLDDDFTPTTTKEIKPKKDLGGVIIKDERVKEKVVKNADAQQVELNEVREDSRIKPEAEVAEITKMKTFKSISVALEPKVGYTPVAVTEHQVTAEQVPFKVDNRTVWISHTNIPGSHTVFIKSQIKYEPVK